MTTIALWLGLLLAASAAASPPLREWRFDVYLDNRPIGTHRVVLQRQGRRESIVSSANYRVKLLMITLYRYQHCSEEQWQDDCLLAIDARTNDNGEELVVTGRGSDRQFRWHSGSGRQQIDDCVMTFAYWNPAILRARQLLNSQTGELVAVRVTELDPEPPAMAQPSSAKRFRISSAEFEVDLWYSPAGDWLGLQTTTAAGKQLRYQRQPPADGDAVDRGDQ